MLLNTISKITKKGTLKNIPPIPHNFPIKLKKISIIIGLKFSDLLISFGSIKLPTLIWIIKRKAIINEDSKGLRNCINEKIKGKITDNSDPKKGIKFKMNDNIPKKTARSLLNNFIIKKVDKPVNRLVNVLIWK